jgi:subtilisin family serine protease
MTKFIVTANKLNRRKKVPASLPDPNNIFDVVPKNFIFDADEVPDNEMPPTVHDKWYKDAGGLFYWGGGINELRGTITTTTTAPAPQPAAVLKQSFQWFKDLKIEQVWSQFNEQGDNVTVAVLDTGYDIMNDDIKEAVVGVSHLDTATAVGINEIQSPAINDADGHGTFCASILSGRNKKSFTIGIAPKSKLLVGKISEDGGLEPTGLEVILKGIEWAIKSGAEIISISFGKFENQLPAEPGYLTRIQTQFEEIVKNKNVLIFASSGDNPPQTILTRERFPASFENSVSVGATDNGQQSRVTVLSSKTIIHAQGVNVEAYGLQGAIASMTGTSMSTPIVAAVAALAVSQLKKKNSGTWNAADLLRKIYSSGDPINMNGKKIINPLSLFQQL